MSALDGVFNNTHGLKESEVDEINKSFRQFDLNDDGYITRDELKQCLRGANVIALDAVVDSVLKQMDWNHDGRISYGEYLKFMATIYRGEHHDLKRQLGNASDYVGSASGGSY
ncbi:unnamed protein product [Rotaria sp. Silwood1]|nr:unnamed protein product [Rotaria sp. Silwood1]CAF1487402.1 unnamed protein product [Rotaria sp. Silwood1]CAF1565787.1 unnamed protein product [Rotaria sp. Silwood1]CAF3723022.1 unnamed protein product [Rotaria sp. Silwood1]CAF4793595.1 unnamed protein product [Rotaria sp. Silwood1]